MKKREKKPVSAPEQAFGQGEITRLGMHLKELFENQRWRELGDALDLKSVWLFDAPSTVAEALALAEERLQGADQLEVGLDRILKSETGEDRASGSYTCSLMWVEPETWRQHEVQFDLHLGFERSGSEWQLVHAGITRPTPEEIPFPEDDEPETPAAGVPWALAEPIAGVDGQVVVYVPVAVTREQAQALLAHAGAAAEKE